MRAVFRVDASKDIGTGHVMRCLTLANELAARGWQTEFVGRRHDERNLAAHIEAQGHLVHTLPRGPIPFASDDYASWLGCDAGTDAMQTAVVLDQQGTDLLIVDHYAIDEGWETAVRPACGSLLVIDDLGNRRHRCEMMVDGNLGRSRADYEALVPSDCTILAGGDYALLRPEFARCRSARAVQNADRPPRRLFIALGGMDPHNVTARVLASLRNAGLASDCTITVVLGAHSPSIPAVRTIAGQLHWPTDVLTDVREMAELMSRQDFAIGAAGMTAWERCCLGLPSLVLVLAENQRPGAQALSSSGAAMLVEGETDALPAPLLSGLARMLEPATFTRMRGHCFRAIDGLGLQRVLEEIGHVVI
jgi:UDP-2,4-diacetamido-2,4,6-trideoxy-beta-L-altropyranose hydrolase